jgi:hypothetical protein
MVPAGSPCAAAASGRVTMAASSDEAIRDLFMG